MDLGGRVTGEDGHPGGQGVAEEHDLGEAERDGGWKRHG
jgi:hypothetical protein